MLMGLRARIILVVVAVTSVVILAWGITVVNTEAELLRDDAVTRGHEVLATLSIPCGVALANREIETLDAILAEFHPESRRASLSNVAILDADGMVLAHSRAEEYAKRYTDPFTLRALASNKAIVQEFKDKRGIRHLRLSMPVVTGIRWGTATAELSLLDVEERIQGMTRSIVLGSLMMALLAALSLSVFITATMIRPIEGLSEAAKRLSRGESGVRVPDVSVSSEVGLLAQVFNEMATEIEGKTAWLEARVHERTAELETANRALENANANLAAAVEKLEHLANTDGLTGLTNHRAFQEALAFEVRRAKRTEAPLSLLMIDVDHFKQYNDSHGHPAGDRVLIELARILRESLREIDVVARYGGEEFSVILQGADREACETVGKKLRDAVRQFPFPFAESQPEGRITISVGAATFPEDGRSSTALISAADEALYTAKRLGRDQIQLAGLAS